MKEIEVSAPGKLMLFGEHAVVYGHPCIVTAVDQRINVSVKQTNNNRVEIEAPDVGVVGYTKALSLLGEDIPKGIRFLEIGVRNFFEKFKEQSGLKIVSRSEFSSEFGFGSSSAVTVAVTKALAELFSARLSNQELFNLCYKTILDVQGVGSGFDLAAAIWGGTIWFVAGGKEITSLACEELPLVVGYTGIKADTSALVRQVAVFYKSHTAKAEEIFEKISVIVREARSRLEEKDWQSLGQLMDEDQELLEDLGVSTVELANLITAAKDAGAYGAKLSGAGGGDCMIALVSREAKASAEEEISKSGGRVLNVYANAKGVVVK